MMSDTEKTIMDTAAEKISAELEAIKAETGGGNQKVQTRLLAESVGKMLISFCYQSEDFAAALAERDAKLITWARDIVAKHWTTGISDVAAYADAVKYYMPGATVRATFRIDAPRETDDDLLFDMDPVKSGDGAADGTHTAIILDLFDSTSEEV